MKKWVLRKKAGDVSHFAGELSVSAVLARILFNRDIKTMAEAEIFLSPDMARLEPVENMAGARKGFEIIQKSIQNNEKIFIYGDYDADGVMSTVILHKTLAALGADVSYYIPDREKEGYGLNIPAVQHIKSMGCSLLITCDNGIASVAEIDCARDLGLKTIIIDHHEPGSAIPAADAVIDPKMEACPYKFKQMCAAGIVFRFVCGLYEYLETENVNFEEYLALAAIATFCDIVDLVGENRILAKKGLGVINKGGANYGLKALMRERSLSGDIGEYEIGFIIGPCINATGRLDTAGLAVELFLTDSAERARELAEKLAALNDTRKKMTAEACETALENYRVSGKDSKVIIIYDAAIHESIAGIVAGRLKDRLRRPVIVLTASQASGIAKGSARSIDGYDIFAALSEQAHLFERFGGHTMAAGMSIKNEYIPILEAALNDNCQLTDADFDEKIYIDKELALKDITYALAEELSVLSPFGKGNRAPLFGSRKVKPCELKIFAEKNVMRFVFDIPDSYRKLTGICFGKFGEFSEMILANYEERVAEKIMRGVLREADLFLDIVYTIEIDEYNDNVSVVLKIKDFRIGG